jgi:hypothetical protein
MNVGILLPPFTGGTFLATFWASEILASLGQIENPGPEWQSLDSPARPIVSGERAVGSSNPASQRI